MGEQTILLNIDNRGRATLTMNRPEIHNAFDDTLIAALTARLRDLEEDPEVRLVILAATGKSFSSGADMNWMRRMADYSYEQNLADAEGLGELMHTLDTLSKPTIALVQGAAYGGGVGLVACCDIALATRRASFCLSEVKLGLIPAVISPYVVNAIGPRASRRYFLSAEVFDAIEAHRLGLVHEYTADEAELATLAERISLQLLKNGPAAIGAAKKLVARVSRGILDDDMIADTAVRIAEIRAGTEGREGLSAFLDKRTPAWITE